MSSDQQAPRPANRNRKIRAGYFQEEWGYGPKPMQDQPRDRRWLRSEHRRVYYLEDKTGGTARIEFPPLLPSPALREWGQKEARRIVGQLIEARQQMQAPAVFVAEQMQVAPEIVYRLEGTDRDIKLSSAIRYAKALGLEFQIVELEGVND